MFGFIERLDRIYLDNGDYFKVIDTCKTPDAGWETAICVVSKQEFADEMWEGNLDFTLDDFIAWGDDLLWGWDVVENYRTRRQAERGHKKWAK